MVPTLSVALPEVGIVTVCVPVVAPKSPLWVTLTVTSRLALGAGLALTVKTVLPPSVMAEPPEMLTTGSDGAGSSSSSTPMVAALAEPDTV